MTVGIYPTDVASQVKYILENSESSFVVAKDQEQVDKILEVKDSLPGLKKIIVVDMKGLRRYKDPMIISFKDVEALGKHSTSREPHLFEEMVNDTRPDDVSHHRIYVWYHGPAERRHDQPQEHDSNDSRPGTGSELPSYGFLCFRSAALPHCGAHVFADFPHVGRMHGEFCGERGHSSG